MRDAEYDAVVVGSGPNGLAAGIRLAQAGLKTLLLEGHETVGGGTRTAELTLPGFQHDVCSAIHPLGHASSFYSKLPLGEFGLDWVTPPAALAHPMDDGSAVVLSRDFNKTGATLGRDAGAYRKLLAPWVENWEALSAEILAPPHLPRHPLLLARFGIRALQSAAGLARRQFREEHARALFAGMAGHSFLPLEQLGSSAIGLVLGTLGHLNGWPFPRGGASALSDALAAYFESLGGEVQCGVRVKTRRDIPPARLVLFSTSTRDVLSVLGDELPRRYAKQLVRYRYGAGVFKVDWALSNPIPFAAAECARAGTVHLGGTLEEIAAGERTVAQGEHPERPLVLLAQQSRFDDTRAPAGKHVGWAYCHVPARSTVDMTAAIENQVERFAPGFRDTILARHTWTTREFESYNPNFVGGDINGGIADLRQLFFRPAPRLNPYSTPITGVYLASAITPPGGGVHGMCGYHAAEAALKTIS